MNASLLRRLSATGLATLLAASAGAATLVVNTSDRGWYNSDGYASSNDNYVTGLGGVERRSWFTFDLSGVLSPITSANLVLFQPSFGFRSEDSFGASLNATETFRVYDVTSTGLVADGSDEHQTIFTDLGTGTSFGSLSVSEASNGTFVTIALNGSFISALNARLGGSMTIAGVIDGLGGGTDYRSLFNGSGTDLPSDGNTRLELVTAAVPEAGPVAFVLGGAITLTALRRRRKKA